MKNIYFLLFFVLSVPYLNAQSRPDSTLQIGYAGSEPFVMEGEEATGIAPDLWKEIAFNADLAYELQGFASINEGLDAVRAGDIDALIGPVTINAQRAENLSFSQPFFDTEMGILAPIVELSFWDRIKPLFSTNFLLAVSGFLLLLSIVGFLFWAVEGRKYPEDYGKSPTKGIGSGIWLALVTMTTVGYGDMAPRTAIGRVVIGSWMIISLIMATSFVAGIATTLTAAGEGEKTITEIGQLTGKKVAVPNYKKVVDNFKAVGGSPVTVDNAKEGYELLIGGKVDALVYDIVPLQYVFKASDQDGYKLSKRNINPQHYGFVFPLNSGLRYQVDIEILKLKESNDIEQLILGYVQ